MARDPRDLAKKFMVDITAQVDRLEKSIDTQMDARCDGTWFRYELTENLPDNIIEELRYRYKLWTILPRSYDDQKDRTSAYWLEFKPK
jgi:hypothetical protein